MPDFQKKVPIKPLDLLRQTFTVATKTNVHGCDGSTQRSFVTYSMTYSPRHQCRLLALTYSVQHDQNHFKCYALSLGIITYYAHLCFMPLEFKNILASVCSTHIYVLCPLSSRIYSRLFAVRTFYVLCPLSSRIYSRLFAVRTFMFYAP